MGLASTADPRGSAQTHEANFRSISDQAYGALQDYLKSKNMKTTDELLNEVISALPPSEQEKIRNRLHELSPQGLVSFLQPSEIAKFLLYGYLMSGVTTVAMPYFYQAKAYFLASRSQALMEASRTGYALGQEGKTLASLSRAERQTLLNNLQAEREALGTEILDGSIMEKVGIKFKDIAGVEMSEADALAINAKIEEAAAAVMKVGQTEAKALAVAAKITVWTKVFIAVNVVAIIGLATWDLYKEKEIAAELKETIAKVATARLYAQVAERQELVHTDQMSAINMLLSAIQSNDTAVQNFVKKQFAATVTKALTAISEDNTYEMLAKMDKGQRADTSEDPSLEEMKKRAAADATKPLPARTVTAT